MPNKKKSSQNMSHDDILMPVKGGMSNTGKIALGATGLALTAAAVATGVALMNSKTRRKITKRFSKTTSSLKESVPRQYQAIAHQIGLGIDARSANKKMSTSKKKGRKKSER